MDVLHKLEALPTHKVDIFVMPTERVSIQATYWYVKSRPVALAMLAHGTPGELELWQNQAWGAQGSI
jgi:hypothetical protein